jgi:hypothetical protein
VRPKLHALDHRRRSRAPLQYSLSTAFDILNRQRENDAA